MFSWTHRLTRQLTSETFRLGRVQPFLKGVCLEVFGREDGVCDGPFNANGGIVPADARFGLRVINASAFVLELGKIRQHTKTASKASGSEYLAAILRRNLHAKPLAQGWRAFANIDC